MFETTLTIGVVSNSSVGGAEGVDIRTRGMLTNRNEASATENSSIH